jgi:tetratricopeptide (TPR) repeat protein
VAIDKIKVAQDADKLYRAGKKLDAIGKLQLILKDSPKDLTTHNRIGEIYLELNRNDDAIESFKRAAEIFAKDGFYPKAIAVFRRALRIDERRADLHERLVTLYDQSGMSSQAKESLQFLADVYQSKGELDKAVEYETRLVRLEPKNIRARLRLGDLLVRNKKNPEGVAEYVSAGKELVKDGHFAEAAKVFERALQLDNNNITILKGVVDAYAAQKSHDKALALVKAMVEKQPAQHGFKRMLADLYFDAGQKGEAQPLYEGLFNAKQLDLIGGTRLLDLVIQTRGEKVAEPLLKAMVTPLLAKNSGGDAEGLVTAYLREFPGSVSGLELGLKVAEAMHNDGQIVLRLTSLEQVYMQRGMRDEAAAAIEHILEIEPYNDAYRDKLALLKGGAPPPAAPAATLEPEAGESTVAGVEEEMVEDVEVAGESVEAGEDSIEVEIEDAEEPEAPEEIESVEELTPSEAELEVELPQAEPGAGGDEELEISVESEPAEAPAPAAPEAPAAPPTSAKDDKTFIKERLMEAEVFIKYGLLDKAIAQYRAIIGRVPDHLETRQQLKQLYMEQGARDKALIQIIKMVEILEKQGDAEGAAGLLDEALAINPAHPQVAQLASRLSGAQAAPPPPPAKAAPKAAPPPPPAKAAPKAPPPKPEPKPEPPPEIAAEPEAPQEPETLDAPVVESAVFEPAAPAAQEAAAEINWEEIDFYISQGGGMLELAEQMLAPAPDDAEKKSRLAAIAKKRGKTGPIAKAPAKAEPAKPAPLPPKAKAPPPPPPPETEPEPEPEPEVEAEPAVAAPAAAPAAGGGLLDMGDLMPLSEPAAAEKTEDFVDLAAELDAALLGVEGSDEGDIFGAAKKPPEEMSFDEVLADFKKGVDQQVDSEDFSTHYNLGIAYKEMGLYDDASGEFQYCMRSPQYFLEGVSMLGVCLRDQGKFEQAVKWYEEALGHESLSAEQKIALRYEQADTLEQSGDAEGALNIFEQIAAQADTYRGVGERVTALREQLGR